MFPLKPKHSVQDKGKARYHESKTAGSRFGSGDFYGTGVRNPLGKDRGSTRSSLPKNSKRGNSPRSLG
jgi:hypothetical protein